MTARYCGFEAKIEHKSGGKVQILARFFLAIFIDDKG
jgi:hypothetical protein